MMIAIDFDGTITRYTGFKGKGNFHEILPKAKECINKLYEMGWCIIIYTTRLEIHQVKEYLDNNGVKYHHINNNPCNAERMLHPNKLIADIYIDDRAICFQGNWEETFNQIQEFKPWWKKL